jgi:hypothetical protein
MNRGLRSVVLVVSAACASALVFSCVSDTGDTNVFNSDAASEEGGSQNGDGASSSDASSDSNAGSLDGSGGDGAGSNDGGAKDSGPPAATGDFVSALALSPASYPYVAFDPAGGGFVVALNFTNGTINLDATTSLTATAAQQVLGVAKFDVNGKCLWAKPFIGTGGVEADVTALAVDPSGSVYLAGSFSGGNFAVGASTLTLQGDNADPFVFKLDAMGVPVWARNFTSSAVASGSGQCGGIAASKDRVAVSCYADHVLTFTLTNDTTKSPAFVNVGKPYGNEFFAELDPATGKAIWTTVLGADNTTNNIASTPIAIDSADRLAFANALDPGATLHDATSSISIANTTGGQAAIAGVLGATSGTGVFGVKFPAASDAGSNNNVVGSVVFDSKDNLLYGGAFIGKITAGGSQLTSLGDADSFVAKVDGTNGAPIWGRSFGGSNADRSPYIDVDAFDEVFVAGSTLSSDFSVAGKVLPPGGQGEVYTVKLTSAGDPLWGHAITAISDAGSDFTNIGRPISVNRATSALYEPIIATGTIDFGGGHTKSGLNGASFVVTLAP